MLAIVAISYALYKSSTEIHELKTSSITWCCGEMVRPLWGRDLVGCLGLIWGILSRRSVWKKLAFFFLIFHYTHASVLYEELFYTIIYCMISYSFSFDSQSSEWASFATKLCHDILCYHWLNATESSWSWTKTKLG